MLRSIAVLLLAAATPADPDVATRRTPTVSETTATFFEPRQVEDLRSRAAKAAELPGGARDGKWRRMEVDPGRVVAVFDRLRLDPAWVLRGYRLDTGAGGRGIVWAVPRGSPEVEPDGCEWKGDLPRPPGGVGFLEAIRGDGSPLSFLQVSLLTRQLMEMGAIWHSLSWTHQRLVMVEPADWERRAVHTWFDANDKEQEEVVVYRLDIPRGGPQAGAGWSGWALTGAWPKDWRAEVRVGGATIEVRLNVLDEHGVKRLFTLVDTYRPPSLVPETRTEPIATGGPGFVY